VLADVDVARRRLLERGFVDRGSGEGVWVLTRAAAERAGCSPDGYEHALGKEELAVHPAV
jgi:hypothetical protein